MGTILDWYKIIPSRRTAVCLVEFTEVQNLIPDPLNWNQSRNKNSEELTFRPELFIDLLHNKFSYSVELIIQDDFT